jgi:hypothetical protein
LAVLAVTPVKASSIDEFFLPDIFALDHGLKRRFNATHFDLVGAFGVVVN